ncbi:MAG: DUF3047 domain-containing protein [Methylococcaceae bacterium]|nr:DUF3047 domain-containing protein [Methylococcaceae bacterium]
MLLHTRLVLADQTAGIQPVGNFSSTDLQGWEPEYFVAETRYRFTPDKSGVPVLCAESRGAASGLVRQIPVDLRKTPYLNWSWRVDAAFLRHDEKTKQGDDYPARVYVVLDDGPFFWQTKALNYVWAGRAPVDSLWISPYISSNVKLIAVESGNARTGHWRHEKRNVIKDLKLAFGKVITRIDAVAIMTDTDNTGSSARACYGDIFFSAN